MVRYVGPRQIVVDDTPAPVPFWAWDRRFEGEAIAVIGGGPSHAAIDLGLLRGHPFVAVNSACRHVRPAATERDILFFHDNSWAENRPELIEDWPGLVVTSNRHAKARLGERVKRIDMMALTEKIGVLPDYVGASSGHTAACLVAVMGGAPVLIGFECREIAGKTHGHVDYQQHDLAVFEEQFLPGWRGLAVAFDRMGVEVVNATPGSAITDFRFADLGEALRG